MIIEKKRWLRWVTFPTRKELRWSLVNVYLQSDAHIFSLTHVRKPFTSYVLDLTKSESELFKQYSKKLQENIKRANRDNITVERDHNPAAVVDLFQETIREKKLNPLQAADFSCKKELLVSRAIHPELGIVAAHAYQLDITAKKVKLDYNASAFRKYPDNKQAQYACGRANSLLFHQDFLYFQERGLLSFDFGGYGQNTPKVDYFKDRFSGKVVTQYNYYPIWYYFARWLRNYWKRTPDARQ